MSPAEALKGLEGIKLAGWKVRCDGQALARLIAQRIDLVRLAARSVKMPPNPSASSS